MRRDRAKFKPCSILMYTPTEAEERDPVTMLAHLEMCAMKKWARRFERLGIALAMDFEAAFAVRGGGR
jgi:hypothetical protein